MALRLSGSLAARPDASAARGAFYFATATAEVFTVDFTGLTGADVAGKAFTCADADGAVYFWFNTGADDDPTTGGRGVEVAVDALDEDTDLAAALAAIEDDQFTFSASGAVVTVTNAETGTRTNADDGDSGTTVATTVPGAADESGVFESDGIGWVPRLFLDRADVVDRTEGELADLPDPAGMVGWLFYATDTEDTYEAFPTGWFLVP